MDIWKTIIVGLMVLIFILLITVLLGWFGGKEASVAGAECEWGGGSFCWKWHKDITTDIQEGLEGDSTGEIEGILGIG
jgi:hypothetical protein